MAGNPIRSAGPIKSHAAKDYGAGYEEILLLFGPIEGGGDATSAAGVVAVSSATVAASPPMSLQGKWSFTCGLLVTLVAIVTCSPTCSHRRLLALDLLNCLLLVR